MIENKTQFYIEQIGNIDTSNYQGKNFLTLKEYESCVRSVVMKYYRHLFKILIMNEEMFCNLVFAAMMADWRFDGRGSISGYRIQCVKWAIKKSMIRLYQCQRFTYLSTEVEGNEKSKRKTTLFDLIVDQGKNPVQKLDEILSSKLLTQKERERLTLHYAYSMTLEEIGKIDNVSKQAVEKCIRKALSKLYMEVDK